MEKICINTKVFDDLYAEYRPRFIAIAKAFVREQSVAEDIVTDSFLTFWEKRGILEVSSEGKLPSYILGIVRHKCLDELRKRQNVENLEDMEQKEIAMNLRALENSDLPKILYASDVQKIFKKRLEEMPVLSAQVFLANRDEGLTYAEIAKKYNLSVRQVTRKMQFCLRILKSDLSDYLKMLILMKV